MQMRRAPLPHDGQQREVVRGYLLRQLRKWSGAPVNLASASYAFAQRMPPLGPVVSVLTCFPAQYMSLWFCHPVEVPTYTNVKSWTGSPTTLNVI